jgi:hypothetical protein
MVYGEEGKGVWILMWLLPQTGKPYLEIHLL